MPAKDLWRASILPRIAAAQALLRGVAMKSMSDRKGNLNLNDAFLHVFHGRSLLGVEDWLGAANPNLNNSSP